MRCFKKTQSGAVCEIEVFSVPNGVKITKNTKPKPVNVRTDEEKARYNNYKSEKHFVRLVNTNFTSVAYYVTLTYNNEHLPESYTEASKNLENYVRRLRYSNPHAKVIAVTGYGSRSGRLHHHLIVSGVSEGDILGKWSGGEIVKTEHLRKDNYYNGVNHGEDFTALAVYLHKHAPAEHKGKRWKQTKNIQQPMQEKAKEVKRVYISSFRNVSGYDIKLNSQTVERVCRRAFSLAEKNNIARSIGYSNLRHVLQRNIKEVGSCVKF